jgi:hypothetical protein
VLSRSNDLFKKKKRPELAGASFREECLTVEETRRGVCRTSHLKPIFGYRTSSKNQKRTTKEKDNLHTPLCASIPGSWNKKKTLPDAFVLLNQENAHSVQSVPSTTTWVEDRHIPAHYACIKEHLVLNKLNQQLQKRDQICPLGKHTKQKDQSLREKREDETRPACPPCEDHKETPKSPAL